MNKVRLFLLIFLFLSHFYIMAQGPYSVEQFVVAGAGSSDNVSDGYVVDWTLGETIIETLNGSKKKLSQGFHQANTIPINRIVPLTDISEQCKENFNVFPNPFMQNICIERSVEGGDLSIDLYNTSGILVYRTTVKSTEKNIMLTLPELSSAAYILNIHDGHLVNNSLVIIKK